MAKNYEILFSGALGAYRGEVVSAEHFKAHGGVDRYIRMGAIKETDAPETQDAEYTASEAELELTDGDGNAPDDTTDDSTDGRGYTKEALLSIAKEKGIEVPAKATKAEIVALLDAANK